MPVIRPHDMTLIVVAFVLTLTVGLEFGLLLVLAVFVGDELDNFL